MIDKFQSPLTGKSLDKFGVRGVFECCKRSEGLQDLNGVELVLLEVGGREFFLLTYPQPATKRSPNHDRWGDGGGRG